MQKIAATNSWEICQTITSRSSLGFSWEVKRSLSIIYKSTIGIALVFLVVLVLMPNTSEAASGSGHCNDDSATDIWLSRIGREDKPRKACCSCTYDNYWYELDCENQNNCECIASDGALYIGDGQAVSPSGGDEPLDAPKVSPTRYLRLRNGILGGHRSGCGWGKCRASSGQCCYFYAGRRCPSSC